MEVFFQIAVIWVSLSSYPWSTEQLRNGSFSHIIGSVSQIMLETKNLSEKLAAKFFLVNYFPFNLGFVRLICTKTFQFHVISIIHFMCDPLNPLFGYELFLLCKDLLGSFSLASLIFDVAF